MPRADAVPGDSDTVEFVKVTAGEAHLGQVGGHSYVASVTPTLTVAGTYASGDYVGTSGTAISFPISRISGQGGLVNTALLIDAAKQDKAAELWLFDSPPTPPADNAAWSISDADAAKVIAVIPFSTYYDSSLNGVSRATVGLPAVFRCTGSLIYGCLVTRSTPVYTNGDITIRLGVTQD